MKKLIVTILTVVFALTLALGVVGCGNNKDEGTSTCKHQPGQIYAKVDNENHSYKCKLCKETIKEKHKWVEFTNDGDGDMVYNCQKCGIMKDR